MQRRHDDGRGGDTVCESVCPVPYPVAAVSVMNTSRRAEDAGRALRGLSQMRGVLIARAAGDEDGLRPMLLSETRKGSVTERQGLVELILPEKPEQVPTLDLSTLPQVFMARQSIWLDPARLGRWSYQLSCLRDRQGLRDLIASGEGALRAWRGEDVDGLMDGMSQLYNDLNVSWLVANVPCGDALLPLLMYAPQIEVESWIDEHAGEIREALRSIAVLDARGKFDVVPRCREVFAMVAGYLDAPLPCASEATLYELGVRCRARCRGGAMTMVLCALCKGDGGETLERAFSRLEKMCGLEQKRDGGWVETLLWKVAHLNRGEDAFLRYFLDEVCRPLRQSWATSRSFAMLGEDFLRGCRGLDVGEHERGASSVYLPEEMERLRGERGGKKLVYQIARALLSMVQRWSEEHAPTLEESSPWPSQGALWRAVWAVCEEDGEEALTHCAWVGEILWYEIEKVWSEVRAKSAQHVVHHCARIVLYCPRLQLPGLASCTQGTIRVVHSIAVEEQSEEHLIEAWPWLKDGLEDLGSYYAKQLLKLPHLTADEGRTILKHGFVKHSTNCLPKSPRKRREVLAQLDRLAQADLLSALDPGSGWLLTLLSQFDFFHGYALTVMAGKIASYSSGGALAARQIQALCMVGAEPARAGAAASIHETFTQWLNAGEVTCEAHRERASELAAYFANMQEARGQIEQYFHHRRLLGEPEELSRNIMDLVEQQSKSEHRTSQVRAITELLEGELPQDRREKLVARLEKLRAPQDERDRWKGIRRRASNLLSKSLTQVMTRSFEHCLSRSMLDALESLCGVRYSEERLTPELRVLLTVSQSEEFHLPLFKRYIQLALGSGDIGELEENARWEKRMRQARPGVDLDAWRAGFEHETSLEEKTLRIHTETDLILGAHMGTGFDSCLSLKEGMYAMSALGHNLEMNKHVVYVRLESGEVIARKLVAIVHEGGAIVGYPVYCKDEALHSQFAYLIDMAVARFARDCGLQLHAHGKPEPLITPDFGEETFYLDGVEPWSIFFAETKVFPETPGEAQGWCDSLDVQMEWAYFDACERRDHEMLSAIAWRRRAPWSELSRGVLMRLDRGLALKHYADETRYGEKNALWVKLWQGGLFSLDEFVKVANDYDDEGDVWEPFERGFERMSLEPAMVQAMVERATTVLRRIDRDRKLFEACEIDIDQSLPLILGLAPLATLIEYMKRLCMVLVHKRNRSWFRRITNKWGRKRSSLLLKLSWALHGPDIEALSRGLSEVEDDLSALCLCELACEVKHMSLAGPLRQLWRQMSRSEGAIEARFSLYLALRHQDLDARGRAQLELEARECFEGTEVWQRFEMLDAEAHAAKYARTLRRSGRRALESTMARSQAQRCNQIEMPEVHAVFMRLAMTGGDEAPTLMREVAKMCHVVDIATHEQMLESLIARHMEQRRLTKIGEEMRSLQGMHRAAHGSPEGLKAIFEDLVWARNVLRKKLEDGQREIRDILDEGYLWCVSGHRIEESGLMGMLSNQMIADLIAPFGRVYVGLHDAEMLVRWSLVSPDPDALFESFFDRFPDFAWNTRQTSHWLGVMFVLCMGLPDRDVASGAAALLSKVLARHRQISNVVHLYHKAFTHYPDAEEMAMLREVVVSRLEALEPALISDELMDAYMHDASSFDGASTRVLLELLEGLQGRWGASHWKALRNDLQKRADNNGRARALLRWLDGQACGVAQHAAS